MACLPCDPPGAALLARSLTTDNRGPRGTCLRLPCGEDPDWSQPQYGHSRAAAQAIRRAVLPGFALPAEVWPALPAEARRFHPGKPCLRWRIRTLQAGPVALR